MAWDSAAFEVSESEHSDGEFAESAARGHASGLIARFSRKHREGEISTNSGGLSRARARLPEGLCQDLFLHGARNIEEHFKKRGHRESNIYLMDGLVLAVAHTKETVAQYGKLKHKVLHYPRARCVAAHRLDTGVCFALSIGNYTEHEIVLLRKALAQIPTGSTVVMDRGFASPALVGYAQGLGIRVVVRRLRCRRRVFKQNCSPARSFLRLRLVYSLRS